MQCLMDAFFSRDFATKIDGSIAGGTLSSHLGSVRGSFPLIHTYSPQCCSMRSPDRLHDTDCKWLQMIANDCMWLHVIACDCMWLHYGWATKSYCQRIRMDKVWKIIESWMECSCWVAELLSCLGIRSFQTRNEDRTTTLVVDVKKVSLMPRRKAEKKILKFQVFSTYHEKYPWYPCLRQEDISIFTCMYIRV